MTHPPYTRILQQAAPADYDLSVITVCRNVLPQLKRTTASVLGQKAIFSNVSIEHVIVDGASADGTPEWLEEMKAQGKIDTYISEPDRGIYDAMNKGINMAHGRILLFLNADDVFEHVDLEPCIAPILTGETRMTAAVTRQYNDTAKHTKLFRPSEKKMYLASPICHQAFFAEAKLYRELGGYRAEMFRCAADTDFMYRAADFAGFPTIVDMTVTSMPFGGFSADCNIHFCDELITLLALNKPLLLEHCRRESTYCAAVAAELLNHCLVLRRWQLNHTRNITPCIRELQELCKAVHDITPSRKVKSAMRFAAETYLNTVLQKKECTLYQWYRIRSHRKHCDLSADNPYREAARAFSHTWSATLLYYVGKCCNSVKKAFQ